MIYNIDWLLMSIRLLAGFFRDPMLVSLIFVTKQPLFTLNNEFKMFRERINEEITYNSQHLVYEYLLNKRFNNNTPGIYIKGREVVISDTYVYNIEEGQDTVTIYNGEELNINPELDPIYIYDDNEKNATDFVVYVPLTLINISTDLDLLAELKATLDKYKFEGVNYSIENY